MEIKHGFIIDDPSAFVPWRISEQELREILPAIRRVTDLYYTLPVTVLGGLQCMLGFHFRDTGKGLKELEFFRTAYPDQQGSYGEFQRYFEGQFGPPTSTVPGDEGFPFHEWRLPGVKIVHCVFERFGPAEHMRIQKAA